MTYSYPEIRQFKGRYAQRNSFELPDGALETALNVTVANDFIISKRRGYYTFFTPPTGILKSIENYERTLIGFYTDKVSHFADTGTSPNLVGAETINSLEAGVTVSITGTRVPRPMQASENLYFTTTAGIRKLTAFDSAVSSVSAPPAMDLSAVFVPGSVTTWFGAGKSVSYRVLFGRRDANDNLIIGAPSDVATISNPATTGVSYISAPSGPNWLVTVTSTAHGQVTGNYLELYGAVDPDANGIYQITISGPNAFTYIVTSGDPTSGTINWAQSAAVLLETTVPEECASVAQGWFIQIYRNDQQNIGVDPFSTYKLLTQRALSTTEIALNVLYFTDTTPDLLRGAELYTNENTQEGEGQANYSAPKPTDMCLFKNYAFYSNCELHAFIEFAVVDPTKLANGDTITLQIIDVSTTSEVYVARTGVANQLTWTNGVAGGPALTITFTSHGLANGDIVFFSNIVGGTYANQAAVISGVTGSTFNATLTGSGTPTSLFFEGLSDTLGQPIFKLSQSGSFAVALAETAQGLGKAISRNPGGACYARYLSDFSEVPGQLGIFARYFPSRIELKASSTLAGTAFNPPLPTSFASGPQVTSGTILQKHHIYISKVSEPEAVPLLNFIPVGSENQAILRIKALRDSVIVIKEDGVFRLSGDTPQNFVVTILDSTVICAGTDSVVVINNQVAMLSNVGIVLISETAVNIISRKIEEDIRPILGRPDSLSHGISYESERLYLLTASRPNDSALSVCHIYNNLTDEWTIWDTLFIAGIVGPEDTLYLVTLNNTILRERKSQTRIDFSDQFYPSTILAVAPSLTNISFSVVGVIPEAGDMFVFGNAITRLKTLPAIIGINQYSADVQSPTGLLAGDTPIFYKGIRSIVATSPFHAGATGRAKQFSQMQLHFRSDQCSRLGIFFTGDVYLGSDPITWQALWQRAGWGFFPWAFDFFGQGDGIDLPIGTAPAPICRIYVPIQQQRTTFIKTYIEHTEAGEQINLQAQSWAIRAYAERVTR